MIVQIRATAAAEWIVRVCTPTWLNLVDRGYAEPIKDIHDIIQLGPHLQSIGETAQAVHAVWEKETHTSGMCVRDAARAAASVAVWNCGWPEMAKLAWSYEWQDDRLKAWQYAWNASKVSIRHASWGAARDAGLAVSGFAHIDNASWIAAHTASTEALRATSLELKESSSKLLKRLNISVEV